MIENRFISEFKIRELVSSLINKKLKRIRHKGYFEEEKLLWITGIEFQYHKTQVSIYINQNNDTLFLTDQHLILSQDEKIIDLQDLKPWINFINKKLQFVWTAKNHLGYLDTIILGFDNHRPSIIFSAVASQIYQYPIDYQSCYEFPFKH